MQLISGKITEQERRAMSVRAFYALKAAAAAQSDFMQRYAALCAVRALGDGLSVELMHVVQSDFVGAMPFALQQVVNEIQSKFLWSKY